jgi:hypothetical protein
MRWGRGMFEVLSGPGWVEAWSTTRLPFEPKGSMRTFRDELRGAIKQLEAADHEGLHATYSSLIKEFCDVENVLIYNVGSSAFRNLASRQLSFERSYGVTPVGQPHVYRYEVLPLAKPRSDVPIARWRAHDLSPLREGMKLTTLWWAIRGGQVTSSERLAFQESFDLEINVQGPRPVNLASIVKVIVDASVLALQLPSPEPVSDEVARRISGILEVTPAAIADALAGNDHGVIPSQGRLVGLRGKNSVHWYPADDGCESVTLGHTPAERWALSGALHRRNSR